MEPFKKTFADFFAVYLPALSAILAIAAGVLAILKCDDCAAALGILGGMAAAGGIVAAYFASKIRDDEMRFWINDYAQGQAQPPSGFGS